MARPIRLMVFDMEGTLTADPTVWEIMHVKNGTWESHGLPYWEEYKAGGIGYDEFARKDVAAWQGAPLEMLDASVREAPLMPGCAELLGFCRDRGILTAIVSNGLERLALRLQREFDMARVAANRERVADGALTGGLDILVPYAGKGEVLGGIAREFGISLEETVAVGDGRADIGMFRLAGVSVAFRPERPEVARAARHVVTEPDLRRVIPLLNGRQGKAGGAGR